MKSEGIQTGALQPTSLFYSETSLALLFTAALTIIICLLEVFRGSKASLRACLGIPLLFYITIFITGNFIGTLLIFPILRDQIPGSLLEYMPFLSSFSAVFAFQGVISHANISLYENGVLTIEDWIKIAKDYATASAIERQVKIDNDNVIRRADIIKTLPDGELNTYIANFSGSESIQQIETDAAQARADSSLYKALWISSQHPISSESLVKRISSSNKANSRKTNSNSF